MRRKGRVEGEKRGKKPGEDNGKMGKEWEGGGRDSKREEGGRVNWMEKKEEKGREKGNGSNLEKRERRREGVKGGGER